MADEIGDDGTSERKDSVISNLPLPEAVGTKEGVSDHGNSDENQGGSKQPKVEISLKPTGDAPIIKKKKWAVPTFWKIEQVMAFIRNYMKLDSSSSLFFYVNQAFAPCPDDEVGNVHQLFNINGTLVLHYSTSPAWG